MSTPESKNGISPIASRDKPDTGKKVPGFVIGNAYYFPDPERQVPIEVIEGIEKRLS